jgi:hypothetical protein
MLEGHRHADLQAINTAMAQQLCTIPESAFHDCFKDHQKRWKPFIDAGGSHFERGP